MLHKVTSISFLVKIKFHTFGVFVRKGAPFLKEWTLSGGLIKKSVFSQIAFQGCPKQYAPVNRLISGERANASLFFVKSYLFFSIGSLILFI